MSLGLHLAALSGFAALMIAMAIEDGRRLIIPNRIVLALAVLWPLYFATGGGASSDGLAAVAAAAAIFVVGALIFARGLIGGGDVKLLSVAALWAGADRLPLLLALTGLIGGALALACLTPLGLRVADARRAAPGSAAAVAGGGGIPVPYGMAIAAAALIVTIAPSFG